jgi:hypothetical protein
MRSKAKSPNNTFMLNDRLFRRYGIYQTILYINNRIVGSRIGDTPVTSLEDA